MIEKLELPRLVREADACALEVRKAENGKTHISLSASSTYPVDRYGATEVLSHDAGSVRLDRAKRGAMPLLFNHNWDDPIGMVDRAAVSGGKLNIDAVMFETDRAREVLAMVDGGLRNVSIGYQLHAVTEDVKTGTYTATDWEPYEVSIVTVPADPTVGVGRDAPGAKFEVRVMPKGDPPDKQDSTVSATEARTTRASSFSATAASSKSLEDKSMSDENKAAATSGDNGVDAAQAAVNAANERSRNGSALDLEVARKRSIEMLCKANNIDERIKDRWITGGMSIDNVAEDLLKIVEERGKSNPKSSAKLDLTDKETQRFSLLRAITAITDSDWSKAGFEAECSRTISQKMGKAPDPRKFYVPYEVQNRSSINQRALAQSRAQRDVFVATASAGGYLVGTENQSFIEVLRNRMVAYKMGARQLTGLVGNVTVPKQTGAATAVWLASETATATESQQTFGQMSLSPKTVSAYTEISRLLLLQSSPDAEGIVNADLAAVTAIAVDNATINGSGSAGQPTGIINTSGIGSVTATSLDYGKALDFQIALANANIVPESGGYVTTPSVAKLFMTRPRFTNTDTPLWVGNLWDGEVIGFKATSSLQIPSANAIFGDWSQLVVGEWGVLEIAVNPFANFQGAIVGVRAIMTMDVGLRYPAAFALSTSVT